MSHSQTELRYYLEELTALREQGREFARRYPAVGERLELGAGRPADPHVERLIESFAFLTGRLQRQIDAGFPRISGALLEALYPQLATIVPSMAIACFEPDPARNQSPAGYTIARGTPVLARNAEAIPCRFRTAYPVTLWPIRLTGAAVEPPAKYDWLHGFPGVQSVLSLHFEALGPDLAELNIGSLRLHLDGEGANTASLYDLLSASLTDLAVTSEATRCLSKQRLQPVGFAADDDLLPYPAPAHAAFRLLQEYFHFPQKFLFFDLDLSQVALHGRSATVHFLFDMPLPAGTRISPTTFRLGCTPIVNLFPRLSEPIRLDQRRPEYSLVADHRRERTTEIHSILSVSSVTNPADPPQRLEPYHSFRQLSPEGSSSPRVFWHARRSWRNHDPLPGTDIHLSFVDPNFSPLAPAASTVYAELLCTNRLLASELPAGAALELDQPAPVAAIHCLDKPTAPSYPELHGAALWQLVSHLSLNHLSLSGPQSLAALQGILRLYSPDDRPATRRQIDSLTALTTRSAMRHTGVEAWRGFRRGVEVTLGLDEDLSHQAGSSATLFAAVVRHFLGLYVSTNSFVELAVRRPRDQRDWLRWPALSGAQTIL